MKSNIIMLLTGIIILITCGIIYFIFKEKLIHHKFNYNKNNKELIKVTNNKSASENDIILKKIKKLEEDVILLKNENIKLAEAYRKSNTLFNDEHSKNTSFKPVLNYNLFIEKNKKIVELYNKGKSNEEIAKALNKSIREIEMVTKLVK